MLAATVRLTRDLDLAEECVQDAYAQALSTWPRSGIPAKPGAWLTTVARRRALDVMRRESTLKRVLPMLVADDVVPESAVDDDREIPDDRLRLICTCCHPALAADAQVALTLRLLCGLSTGEVARAFLVSETTMAARITRAKKKIAIAGIPYRVPTMDELPARIDAVLAVVHLVFTTGHSAPSGSDLVRVELLDRSLELARLLRRFVPRNPAVGGLLALILLTGARRHTRLDTKGQLVLLEDQDRARWDRVAIAEGVTLVRESLRGGPPGRYVLEAAISAVHSEAPTWTDTDWPEIVGLYGRLAQIWPSPVVRLNRAVAIGFRDGPDRGLAALDELAADPRLATYPYLAASRADLLRRLGRLTQARQAYDEALLLTDNEVERVFLRGRLGDLEHADD